MKTVTLPWRSWLWLVLTLQDKLLQLPPLWSSLLVLKLEEWEMATDEVVRVVVVTCWMAAVLATVWGGTVVAK